MAYSVGLCLFSTALGKKPPRPAPSDPTPLVARGDRGESRSAFIQNLKQSFPTTCKEIYSGWILEDFFDEHDIKMHSRPFLESVIAHLAAPNNRRVREYAFNLAKTNQQWIGMICRTCLPSEKDYVAFIEGTFPQMEIEKHGVSFLGHVVQHLKWCAYELQTSTSPPRTVPSNSPPETRVSRTKSISVKKTRLTNTTYNNSNLQDSREFERDSASDRRRKARSSSHGNVELLTFPIGNNSRSAGISYNTGFTSQKYARQSRKTSPPHDQWQAPFPQENVIAGAPGQQQNQHQHLSRAMSGPPIRLSNMQSRLPVTVYPNNSSGQFIPPGPGLRPLEKFAGGSQPRSSYIVQPTGQFLPPRIVSCVPSYGTNHDIMDPSKQTPQQHHVQPILDASNYRKPSFTSIPQEVNQDYRVRIGDRQISQYSEAKPGYKANWSRGAPGRKHSMGTMRAHIPAVYRSREEFERALSGASSASARRTEVMEPFPAFDTFETFAGHDTAYTCTEPGSKRSQTRLDATSDTNAGDIDYLVSVDFIGARREDVTKLFVHNLPKSMEAVDVKKFFEEKAWVTVEKAERKTDRKDECYYFVYFANAADARKALTLNGDRSLNTEFANGLTVKVPKHFLDPKEGFTYPKNSPFQRFNKFQGQGKPYRPVDPRESAGNPSHKASVSVGNQLSQQVSSSDRKREAKATYSPQDARSDFQHIQYLTEGSLGSPEKRQVKGSKQELDATLAKSDPKPLNKGSKSKKKKGKPINGVATETMMARDATNLSTDSGIFITAKEKWERTETDPPNDQSCNLPSDNSSVIIAKELGNGLEKHIDLPQVRAQHVEGAATRASFKDAGSETKTKKNPHSLAEIPSASQKIAENLAARKTPATENVGKGAANDSTEPESNEESFSTARESQTPTTQKCKSLNASETKNENSTMVLPAIERLQLTPTEDLSKVYSPTIPPATISEEMKVTVMGTDTGYTSGENMNADVGTVPAVGNKNYTGTTNETIDNQVSSHAVKPSAKAKPSKHSTTLEALSPFARANQAKKEKQGKKKVKAKKGQRRKGNTAIDADEEVALDRSKSKHNQDHELQLPEVSLLKPTECEKDQIAAEKSPRAHLRLEKYESQDVALAEIERPTLTIKSDINQPKSEELNLLRHCTGKNTEIDRKKSNLVAIPDLSNLIKGRGAVAGSSKSTS